MIEPTVGRIVWYRDRRGDVQPCAAIVTWVHSVRRINLAVFEADGLARGEEDVWLAQEGEEIPQGPYAEWMPYQKGQAAKYEALAAEKKV